jgi:transcriptional regulator with GAF, ATPase, and Fis domain
VLFLEELDRRSEETEPLARFLLGAQVELVALGARLAREDAVVAASLPDGAELRTLEPRPIAAKEVAAAAPSWLGGALSPALERFLAVDRELDPPRLVQTLSYLVEAGALSVDEGIVQFDPARVDLRDASGDLLDVVRRRVARVDGGRRRALEALAILDADSERAEIAALAPEVNDAALSQLSEAGLVERTGDRFRCAGGDVAAVVLETLPLERARELHRAAALHFEHHVGATDAALRRARHAYRAALDGGEAFARAGVELLAAHRLAEAAAIAGEVERDARDESARRIARLVRGVTELRRGSHAEAERLLAPLSGELEDPPLRARAVVEHARALDRCGRPSEALRALDAMPRELQDVAPGARALRAYLLHQLQRDAEAEAACREALAQPIPSAEEPPHGLQAMLAVSLWRLDRPDEARRAFDAAIAAARAADKPLAVAAIENNLARFEHDCGRSDIALELFRRALGTSSAFADRQQECMVAYNLASTLSDVGRFADAKLELERARAIAHRMQRPAMLRRIALQQAQVALQEGDVSGAHALLDESVRLARAGADARGEWLAELVRSEVFLQQGRVRSARVLLRRLGESPLAKESPELARYLAEYELKWAATGGSRRAVEKALGRYPPLPNSWKRRVLMRDARLGALLRLKRHVDLAAAAEEQLDDLGDAEMAAMRAHALAALVVARSGRTTAEEARRLADQARSALAVVNGPGDTSRRAAVALVLGRALDDAALLDEAQALARRSGHVPIVKRAIAASRRLVARTGAGAVDVGRLAALERLMAVGKEITATTDGEALLRSVLDHAIDSTRARRGFLILEKDGNLAVRAARNLAAADIERPELSFSSSVAREVARDGKPVLLSDVSADARFRDAASISALKLISVLCVPLRNRQSVVGSIYLDDPTRIDAFSERDLRYVEDLSDFAAIALEKAELLQANRERQAELERTQRDVERLNRELQGALIENQSELKEARAQLEKARRQVTRTLDFEGIVSQSAAMEDVKRKIELFADSELPVFISGESGTGKELVARALHRKSGRRTKPYESLNCASMQPHLVENELFGHLRGAFTGADADHAGLFERVDGGTLFLDEVCDAPLELQSKLLRVVQFGEVQRLGGGAVRKVDVRIVAASNRDVQKEVAAGRFREDLMYRLVVLSVHLPPLRDRREDIPLLIEHFERRHAARMKAQPLSFSAPAWKRFVAYGWPGNVRELENAVQRLLVLHRDGEEIGLDDLRAEAPAVVEGEPMHTLPLREFVDQQERAYILEVLARNGDNRVRAAKDLGISERNLYQKLQRFRDEPPRPSSGPEDARGASGP